MYHFHRQDIHNWIFEVLQAGNTSILFSETLSCIYNYIPSGVRTLSRWWLEVICYTFFVSIFMVSNDYCFFVVLVLMVVTYTLHASTIFRFLWPCTVCICSISQQKSYSHPSILYWNSAQSNRLFSCRSGKVSHDILYSPKQVFISDQLFLF